MASQGNDKAVLSDEPFDSNPKGQLFVFADFYAGSFACWILLLAAGSFMVARIAKKPSFLGGFREIVCLQSENRFSLAKKSCFVY